jgi:hypothetical protein
VNSDNGSALWELSPEFVGSILQKNEELCVERISRYFGRFESRLMTKAAAKKKDVDLIGFTGSFFEKYSEKSDPNCFDGNDVSAAISLSITGASYWVASLLNEEIDLSVFTKFEYGVCISEVGIEFFDDPQISKIYGQLKLLNGISRVTASKLLASKRPNLFPIFDNDVSSLFLHSDGKSWQQKGSYLAWCKSMQIVLADKIVSDLLKKFLESSGEVCQPLRALDVIFWLESYDRNKNLADLLLYPIK